MAKEGEGEAPLRRLRLLSLHLDPSSSSSYGDPRLVPCGGGGGGAAARRRRPSAVSVAELTEYMRGRHRGIQMRVFEFFASRPELATPVEVATAEHREICMRQLSALVREAGIGPQPHGRRPSASSPSSRPRAGRHLARGQARGPVQGFESDAFDFLSLWGGTVINLGTEKHREKYFDGIDNLDYPGCFAMTELHHGSNVQGLQTTATFDPLTDEFIIDTPNDGAIKWWIGNAAVHGKFATVFAKLILPLQEEAGGSADMGSEICQRMGNTRAPSPPSTRVTIATRYSLLRHQFGPPREPEVSILDYQSHQHKLMPMLASTYAFHFTTLYLVDKYSEMKKSHDDDVVADVHALSAGLKAYVTSYTAKSLSVCREACGGHGYAAVNRFGILRNDHDIFQTFEGDNTVLLQQVAADLLKQYKEKFKGGTLTVTWNYLRESMASYLSQPNPVTTRWEGTDHLRDPNFQLDAFRYRTSRLLQSVAVRIRKHTKTLGGFGAWNRCLNHLLTLAESHIESVILAKFIDAVQRCPDENTRGVLKLLCDLYALDRIWKDIGTYRNVDYVAPNKAKAIHKLTEYLSFQVRGFARELVDAFDLPDLVTRAPIGMQSEHTHSIHNTSDSRKR
ncbi:Acyl-coenzyme A oxidase 2, peroxisomal [Ananas comosus]|uniref:Acyl-coenzyme A oxidase n=1 Tax=Ananas comosus TaxID=4615 RepID=A0A199V3D3_ANACO|nr:Acyl-coenzyme A oxidase 2, peroxisomal [Ananas comosus]